MSDVPEALTSEQLARRLRVSVRTLRSWVVARLVPRPPDHGHLTRFDRRSIIIAHAVAALRRDGVPIPHVTRFIAHKTENQLREIGGLPLDPSPPALHPPNDPPALPADALPSEQPEMSISILPRDTHPRETQQIGTTWQRIVLLPGLELHVRSDASAFAQGLAAAIASGRLPK